MGIESINCNYDERRDECRIVKSIKTCQDISAKVRMISEGLENEAMNASEMHWQQGIHEVFVVRMAMRMRNIGCSRRNRRKRTLEAMKKFGRLLDYTSLIFRRFSLMIISRTEEIITVVFLVSVTAVK